MSDESPEAPRHRRVLRTVRPRFETDDGQLLRMSPGMEMVTRYRRRDPKPFVKMYRERWRQALREHWFSWREIAMLHVLAMNLKWEANVVVDDLGRNLPPSRVHELGEWSRSAAYRLLGSLNRKNAVAIVKGNAMRTGGIFLNPELYLYGGRPSETLSSLFYSLKSKALRDEPWLTPIQPSLLDSTTLVYRPERPSSGTNDPDLSQ